MTGTLASRVRVRSVKILDRFAKRPRPLYVCGIRVELCPFDTSSGVRISCTRRTTWEPHPREGAPGGVALHGAPAARDRGGAKPVEKLRQKRHGSGGGSLRAVDD
jgi:hypothetical protein